MKPAVLLVVLLRRQEMRGHNCSETAVVSMPNQDRAYVLKDVRYFLQSMRPARRVRRGA
jgi:hypothetical protein